MEVSRWCALAACVLVCVGCKGSDASERMATAVPGLNGAFAGATTTSVAPSEAATSGGSGGTTGGTSVASGGASDGGATDGGATGVDVGAFTTGVDAGGAVGRDAGEQDAAPDCDEPLAALVHLDALTLYQGVAVPLVVDGEQPTPRNAPVVQGRDALVRAFVTPRDGFTPHDLTAELTLTNGEDVRTLTDVDTPVAGSDANLESTYNFEVEGALIGPETRFRFRLLEDSCEGEVGDPEDARFPVEGDEALEAEEVGKLRVAFVPVAYEYEAGFPSGTQVSAPDISERALARYRDVLHSFYPVREVEVRVTEPLPWDHTVASNGDGWELLLDGVLNAREEDRFEGSADRDEYYYGLFRPPASAQSFCGGFGCVAGLAPVPYDGPRATGGLGLAYDDILSRETLVHELGHAHGREHIEAGCGEQYTDPAFPYDDGDLGVWGYDILSGELKDPSRYDDMMGYCVPIWISDYTYAALAEWAADLNEESQPRLLQPKRLSSTVWRSLMLLADGTARWGRWQPSEPPSGEPVTVEVLDARGLVAEVVEGVQVPLSHGGSRYLFVPDPGPTWDTLRFEGREVALTDL